MIADAEIAVDAGDGLLSLSELQFPRVFRGLGPLGESLIVSGSAAGIAVEAAFHDGLADAAGISVTLSPDRSLGLVRGVRYFALSEAGIMAGRNQLRALINGYHSWSPCTVTDVTDAAEDVSHGAIGLARGARGLAVVFDAEGPGQAAVRLKHGILEAATEWLPARPLHPAGDSTTMRLAYDPAGDTCSALAALFAPGPADRERFASGAPTGWSSWYEFGDAVTQEQVTANLEFCATHFDPNALRYIQLDDGYQRAAGDWNTNTKFPNGHRWLTDRIHASGFRAGLWLAPFAVTERSGIPAAHPDWLLMDQGRPLVPWQNESWGGAVYALDGAHPKVREWLRALARRAVQDWGYDYLELDFLLLATAGGTHSGGATHAEAYRAGLDALREGAGPDVFLLGSGAPLQHAVGAVNGMRIGPDVAASWSGFREPARATALRAFYQRGAWFNDPDCLVVRPPLSLEEARVRTSLVALSGGMTFLSDDLPRLPPDRLALVRRALPAAPVTGHAVSAALASPPAGPAIVLEDAETVSLAGPWMRSSSDGPDHAAADLDEAGWTRISIPTVWKHPGADQAPTWYRKRFTLPAARPERTAFRLDDTVWLDLGSVPLDHTAFLNGEPIAPAVAPSPAAQESRDTCTRYVIPAGALRWGGENVLALRTAGGTWTGESGRTRCDPPPGCWVVAGPPGWWTVALVNWDDAPGPMSVSLADLGIDAAHCSCYDVWTDTPFPDVTDVLAARVASHATRVFALRPRSGHPQVIGTTRHVVQGVVDLVMETWDPVTGALRGRCANLDGRPYAVTVAVPAGLRPTSCESRPACTRREPSAGYVTLVWPAGAARETEWALRFSSGAASAATSAP